MQRCNSWRPAREYWPTVAQWKAELVANRAKLAKLVTNPRLHDYVQDRLAGVVHDADGHEITGLRQASFKGRNKPTAGRLFHAQSLTLDCAPGTGAQRPTRLGLAAAERV